MLKSVALATALVTASLGLTSAAGAAGKPEVSIDSPRDGAALSGRTVVFASTTSRARKVTFYVDGIKRATESSRPYRYRLDARKLSAGRHSLSVRAEFAGGKTAAASKRFTASNGTAVNDRAPASAAVPALPQLAAPAPAPGLDKVAPKVSFPATVSAAASGAIAGGPCEVQASDNVGVSRVEFTLDGKALNVERFSPYRCRFDTTDVANGPHTVRAVAFDAAGNASPAASTVINVQNATSTPGPTSIAPTTTTTTPTTTTTTTPPPTTGTPPSVAPGREIFVGDYETGSFSQWDSTQQVGGGSASVVSSPVTQGRYAAKFTLPSSGGRAEVLKGGDGVGRFYEGDERIFTWATMPMADAIGPANSFQNILQWKNEGTGSPPIAFELEGDRYAIKATGTGFKFLGPVEAGTWTSFEVRIRFSSSAAQGFIEVKRDGQLIVPRYSTATLFAGKYNYLKQGYYAGDSSGGGTVYHDGMRVTAP